jgi:pilus assembly protein TadC
MTALLSSAWGLLVFAVAWPRRPRRPMARPELEVLLVDESTHTPITARWGRGLQRRIPVLEEVSSVAVGVAVAVAVVAIAVAPTISFMVVVATGLVAGMRQIRGKRARAAALVRQTPAAIELLRLCLAAGMTPRLAMARVTELVPVPLSEDLAQVVARTSRGVPLADALHRMAVLGHPMRPVALGMATAESTGQALGPLLEREGRDARLALRRHIETKARRLPVTMLVPMVTCVLPAFFLIAIVPVIASRLGQMF